MTTPSSGQISLSDVNTELGLSSTTQISMDTSPVRTLAGVSSGAISLSNLRNRTFRPTWNTASGGVGEVYTEQNFGFALSATAGTANSVTYSVVSGSLPSGISLSSNGQIGGTCSAGTVADYTIQTFNFTVRAFSDGGGSADRSFSILVRSRYVGYVCSTTNEGGSVSVTAPGGFIFNRRDFSSYGTPEGSCGSFYFGGCNAGSSNGWTGPIGQNSASVGANNGTWGDPCGGTPKRMYVQFTYGPF